MAQFLIAVYGGYFGGGIGFLMMAALTHGRRRDAQRRRDEERAGRGDERVGGGAVRVLARRCTGPRRPRSASARSPAATRAPGRCGASRRRGCAWGSWARHRVDDRAVPAADLRIDLPAGGSDDHRHRGIAASRIGFPMRSPHAAARHPAAAPRTAAPGPRAFLPRSGPATRSRRRCVRSRAGRGRFGRCRCGTSCSIGRPIAAPTSAPTGRPAPRTARDPAAA